MSLLLDTNIITAIIKDDQRAVNQFASARQARSRICISCITYYEIKRGLLHSNAMGRLSKFERLCLSLEILLIDELEIIETASRIHADLRRRGRPIQDADILIAATAMIHSLTLISNDADLQNVEFLSLDNWL
ncbi:type II toxin-antitoxin system VapC family toxin [Leptolyngbya sp. AN03gr2]|uniref:type II toxin-antitoxin system VapC family toxin n=1 Tax=unclassified Leptolyngbya TaxID=2650499 RepID=UPI003D3117C1